MYSTDLAHIHDQAFTASSLQVAPELLRELHSRGIREGLIVEVGCGSGRLAERLARGG
jgi:2-polyprenyl-3-methyl-5-hydroxy-6-metoxy-1,4-benzoquinol methylase